MNHKQQNGPMGDEPPARWGTRWQRPASRPPRRAIVASVLLHVSVVAAMFLAGVTLKAAEPDFQQFKVRLKSPPAQVLGTPEPVVNTAPVAVEPAPTPPPTPDTPPKPAPKPAPQTQSPQQKSVERTPAPTPAKGPDPKPVEIGGEDIDVDIAGAAFAYPDYLENIILQLNRYFRWPGAANLEAEVVFYIRRDGTVGSPTPKRKSGNFQFDIQTVQAIEAAGRNGAFGPLPEGLQGERLWISFTFKPAGK